MLRVTVWPSGYTQHTPIEDVCEDSIGAAAIALLTHRALAGDMSLTLRTKSGSDFMTLEVVD